MKYNSDIYNITPKDFYLFIINYVNLSNIINDEEIINLIRILYINDMELSIEDLFMLIYENNINIIKKEIKKDNDDDKLSIDNINRIIYSIRESCLLFDENIHGFKSIILASSNNIKSYYITSNRIADILRNNYNINISEKNVQKLMDYINNDKLKTVYSSYYRYIYFYF